ncbi:hypothetical protein AX14_010338 [Amanita brunnescens Koide BX004]|nr:hypothetical protein AX14_010338 [Amanita brunnescens Koide BX004]
MKCLRKVNGSKIKRKIPIEQFLAQREAVDDSDSFAVAALDLPLPPPSASDFPELPRAAPAPKMTKAEKAMANKINALLLSDVKGKPSPAPTPTAAKPTCRPKEQASDKAPAQNSNNDAVVLAAAAAPPKPAAPGPAPSLAEPAQNTEASPLRHKTPPVRPAPALPASVQVAGVIPIPTELRSQIAPTPSPRPSGISTPIMAMATFHAEHAVSCAHDTSTCSRRSACAVPRASTGHAT